MEISRNVSLKEYSWWYQASLLSAIEKLSLVPNLSPQVKLEKSRFSGEGFSLPTGSRGEANQSSIVKYGTIFSIVF
ncbi:MAG: hypothetical protein HC902_14500 [Calothrix sp. SM1_5_4]|nr:hypothetical protein [Calothrix sp. SM1_5_4]